MFEVFDRRRGEVVGMSDTKRMAVMLGIKSLTAVPRRSVEDLVVRVQKHPPVRIIKPARQKCNWHSIAGSQPQSD